MMGSRVGNSGNALRTWERSSEVFACSEMVSREMMRELGIDRARREESSEEEDSEEEEDVVLNKPRLP